MYMPALRLVARFLDLVDIAVSVAPKVLFCNDISEYQTEWRKHA